MLIQFRARFRCCFLLQLFESTRGWFQLKYKELFSDIPTFVNYPPIYVYSGDLCVATWHSFFQNSISVSFTSTKHSQLGKMEASSTSTYAHGRFFNDHHGKSIEYS